MTTTYLFLLFYAFLFGATVGSFLNVVIYRLPMNQSLIRPGSHCPSCGVPVRFYDNIPIISWLLLLGKCRDCGVDISSRYIYVELITAILAVALFAKFGVSPEVFIYSILVCGLLATTFIDIDFQIIPDEITMGGVITGLALSYWLPVGVEGAIIGLAVGGGLLFLIAVIYPGGMGGGDIKLMAAVGAFLGWPLTLLTIFVASITGSAVGLIAVALYGKGRKSKLPFGPFLALGAIFSLFWGETLIDWYLNYFV